MPTYFKPLRRKIGLLTLLLACTFAGFWIGFRGMDVGFVSLSVAHSNDCLNISGQIELPLPMTEIDFEWIVPYSLIVIPLTLLSAWLLLSRPRAKRIELLNRVSGGSA